MYNIIVYIYIHVHVHTHIYMYLHTHTHTHLLILRQLLFKTNPTGVGGHATKKNSLNLLLAARFADK